MVRRLEPSRVLQVEGTHGQMFAPQGRSSSWHRVKDRNVVGPPVTWSCREGRTMALIAVRLLGSPAFTSRALLSALAPHLFWHTI